MSKQNSDLFLSYKAKEIIFNVSYEFEKEQMILLRSALTGGEPRGTCSHVERHIQTSKSNDHVVDNMDTLVIISEMTLPTTAATTYLKLIRVTQT